MNTSSHQVFVYGTLKPGGRYWPRYCEGKVAAYVPAKVRGVLYDLHVGYPGLRLGGDAWVQGYMLTFRREADFLELDVLEDYSPDRPSEDNEYVRLRETCFAEDGKVLETVWIYEVTQRTLQRCQGSSIPSGNWDQGFG